MATLVAQLSKDLYPWLACMAPHRPHPWVARIHIDQVAISPRFEREIRTLGKTLTLLTE